MSLDYILRNNYGKVNTQFLRNMHDYPAQEPNIDIRYRVTESKALAIHQGNLIDSDPKPLICHLSFLIHP